MKDLEEKIEEAAEKIWTWMAQPQRDAFVLGAKSPEAKEYWQQGMWTPQQVIEMLIDYVKSTESEKEKRDRWCPNRKNAIKWFEQYKKKS